MFFVHLLEQGAVARFAQTQCSVTRSETRVILVPDDSAVEDGYV